MQLPLRKPTVVWLLHCLLLIELQGILQSAQRTQYMMLLGKSVSDGKTKDNETMHQWGSSKETKPKSMPHLIASTSCNQVHWVIKHRYLQTMNAKRRVELAISSGQHGVISWHIQDFQQVTCHVPQQIWRQPPALFHPLTPQKIKKKCQLTPIWREGCIM